MNLLSNAVKFTDNGGVTFKVGYHEGKIRFQVEDTGVGIDPESQKKIFRSFEQVGALSRRTEGTGLGLSISSKLTALMGGELQVKSEAGAGATFWFELELPQVQEIAEAAPSSDGSSVVGYQGRRRKVLVVDDQWENRSVLVDMLAPLDFELMEAVNGQEGLAKAIQFQPDVILLDLRMPVMDGFEVMRRIRELPTGKAVKIITVTASAFDFNRQECLEAGCDEFLAKPFQLERLLSLLQTQLNLEWIYDKPQKPNPETDDTLAESAFTGASSLVAPSRQELDALLDLAMRGNIKAIKSYAEQLGHRDANLIPFAAQLRQLAQGFNTQAIQEFVKQFHPGTKLPN
jgi:CheY-like chemotaxis protein